jgi:hypothetical protein
MRFAGAGRPEEVDDLAALDELELGQREDALAIERGLEREVEAGEGLIRIRFDLFGGPPMEISIGFDDGGVIGED